MSEFAKALAPVLKWSLVVFIAWLVITYMPESARQEIERLFDHIVKTLKP